MRDDRPRAVMSRIGQELIRKAPDAEGTLLGTKIALWAVEAALRELEAARLDLETRLFLIDNAA